MYFNTIDNNIAYNLCFYFLSQTIEAHKKEIERYNFWHKEF